MNFKLRNRNSKIVALLVAVLFLFSFFPGYGLAEDTHQPSNSLMGPVNPPTDPGVVPGDKQGGEEPGTNPQGTLEDPDNTPGDNPPGDLEDPDNNPGDKPPGDLEDPDNTAGDNPPGDLEDPDNSPGDKPPGDLEDPDDSPGDNPEGTLEDPDGKEGENPEKTPQEELPLIPVTVEKVSLTIHHVLDLGEDEERLTYTETIDDLDSGATANGRDYQIREEGIEYVGSEPEELVLGDGDNEITLLYNPNLPVVWDQDRQEEFIPENPDGLSEFSAGITTAKPFYYPSSPRMMMRAMPLANNGLQPGEVRLSKKAAPVTGTENQWTVTLSIEGKGKSQTSDVVLVIDKSGSMGRNNRMANTRLAAQAFVDQLLQPNGTTRIAVVAFDDDYHLIEDFTGYSGKEALKAKIASIQASGATNIQAGIHQAQLLLANSTADSKNIVLLGDGEPTNSYLVNGASGITVDHVRKTRRFLWWEEVYYEAVISGLDSATITSIDYDTIVGSGSSYSLIKNQTYKVPCTQPDCESAVNGYDYTGFPPNNGIPTIYEANLAKTSSINIYSIALQAGSNGQNVLNQCQNKGYYTLDSSDLSGLNTVFSQIAGAIALAASNGTVSDPMGAMFDLISNASEITVSQGTFQISADGRTITWHVGDILDGCIATMTYVVQIKPGATANTDYPTNGTTTFDYYNEVTEENGSDDFDVPEVQITKPVYTVEFEAGANGNLDGTTRFEDILEGTAWAAAITSAPTPVADPGYSFVNWTPSLPATDSPITADATYTAAFAPNTDTAYTVNHYQEDLNADTYTLAETENLAGTTGAQTAATAKTYSGFTAQAFNQATIAADGTTVVDIYYSRSSYTLTYAVTGDYFANTAYATATYEFGAAVTAVATPSATGYTFNGWTGVPATMPAQDVTATGYYTANEDTAYTVNHYQEDLNADTYTLAETENLAGTTGALTAATAKTYSGFTAQAFNQATIAADGTTVVDIYYSRSSYTLTYAVTGDYFANTAYATATYEFGAAVTAVATPSATGYTFNGWTGVPATMPAQDVTATGYYTANTDTAYTVNHYQEDLNADTYTLAETENLAGTTGALTAATAKTYSGFTAQTFSQKEIAADGTTVVDIYYSRSSYTLTYAVTGDYFANTAYATATYEFGAAVTAVATPSATGYTFNGWTGVPATMPAQDVTATGYYTANTDTAYTVNHYQEDLNADTYTLAETENLAGTTGALTAATAKTYSGFTAQTFSQKEIAADGTTVVDIYYSRSSYTLTYAVTGDYFANTAYATATYEFGAAVTAIATPSATGYTFNGWTGVPATMPAEDVTATGYYTANTDTAYTVNHYQEDLNADTYTLAETENLAGTTGALTAATAKTYSGFTAQTFSQATIAADGSTVVDIYYSRNSYTLTYAVTGDYFANAAYATATYEFGAAVTAIATPSATGYTFNGWTGVPATMPAQDVTATGYYTANEDTAYTVNHYQEDLNPDTYTLAETENLAGTTGALTAATAKTYSGFTAQAFNQATIAADGTTVVDIYYSRSSYTLTYAVTGDYFANTAYATATYEFGAAVTAVATPSATGYTFNGWTGVPATMPAQDVTATGYYTANEDTAYTVNHYQEDLNADTYTLAETENLAGTTGALTAATAKTYSGFTAQAFNQATIAADGTTVVDIYYSRSSYTLTYAVTGDYFANTAYATATYEFGAAVTAVATPSATGYTFNGWTGVPATMPAQDVTATGYYTANEDTAYRVEHYQKDLTGEGYTVAATVNLTGRTGDPVTAIAKDFTGFTYNAEHPDTVASGIIASDGSLVLKLYYERNSYNIIYKAGLNGTLAGGDRTDTKLYGASYSPAPTPVPNSGYRFSYWSPALPGANDKVTENKTFTAIFASTGGGGGGGGGGGSTGPTTPSASTTPAESEVVVEPEAPLVSLNKEDHYAYMVGYPDDTFRPEGKITREEVATVFYKLLDAQSRQSITTNVNNFTDVEAGRWSSTPISTLAAVNIITGYPDGTFKPGGGITRAELATVASKFDKLSPSASNQFSDITGHWANTYINSAAQKGWLSGYEDGTFRPEQAITRAEFATLVNNVLGRRVKKENILPDAIQFQDLSADAWYYEACQEAVNSHYYERENPSDFEEWTELYEFSITW